MKKLLTFVFMGFLCLSLSSCESKEAKLRRIDQVVPEVNYGYVSVSSSALSHNFEHLHFQSTIAKMLKKGTYRISYPYQVYSTEKYMYFLIQYNNRNGNYFNYKATDNKHEFDIALFRVDLYAAQLEMIYDFKNVVPTWLYNYTMPVIYHLVNDERAIFKYNGKIQVFNPATKEILSSRGIHEESAYIDLMHNPYRINDYGDVYAFLEGELIYYQRIDDQFVKQQFVAGDSINVNRYDDLIVLSTYTTIKEHRYAYDLVTGEDIDLETAIAYEDNYLEQHAEVVRDYAFMINDVKYDYTSDWDSFTFIEREGELSYTIDSAYMIEHSAAYREIASLWNLNTETYFAPQYFRVDAGRLFVVFFEPGFATIKSGFIYEYDLDSNQVQYVGYHYEEGISRIIPLLP